MPVHYKGVLVGDYIADFVVEDLIIVEIKGVSTLNSSHLAQARNYLAATDFRLALLVNFGVKSLQSKRVVN